MNFYFHQSAFKKERKFQKKTHYKNHGTQTFSIIPPNDLQNSVQIEYMGEEKKRVSKIRMLFTLEKVKYHNKIIISAQPVKSYANLHHKAHDFQ